MVFSGDPWRVEIISKMLDNAEHVAFSREFNTYNGYYKGVKITATSTGIGAPSAAIAMEEMYENGMEAAVRMGTVMSLKDDLLGKFIIPRAVMRADGTSSTYAPPGYPAAADIGLVTCMNRSAQSLGYGYHNGIGCSMDGFYSQMKESRLSKQMKTDINGVFERLKALNIAGIDMESGVILTLASLMGIKGCIVTMATVLQGLKDELRGEDRKKAEETLCRVTLEGLYEFDKENRA